MKKIINLILILVLTLFCSSFYLHHNGKEQKIYDVQDTTKTIKRLYSRGRSEEGRSICDPRLQQSEYLKNFEYKKISIETEIVDSNRINAIFNNYQGEINNENDLVLFLVGEYQQNYPYVQPYLLIKDSVLSDPSMIQRNNELREKYYKVGQDLYSTYNGAPIGILAITANMPYANDYRYRFKIDSFAKDEKYFGNALAAEKPFTGKYEVRNPSKNEANLFSNFAKNQGTVLFSNLSKIDTLYLSRIYIIEDSGINDNLYLGQFEYRVNKENTAHFYNMFFIASMQNDNFQLLKHYIHHSTDKQEKGYGFVNFTEVFDYNKDGQVELILSENGYESIQTFILQSRDGKWIEIYRKSML